MCGLYSREKTAYRDKRHDETEYVVKVEKKFAGKKWVFGVENDELTLNGYTEWTSKRTTFPDISEESVPEWVWDEARELVN